MNVKIPQQSLHQIPSRSHIRIASSCNTSQADDPNESTNYEKFSTKQKPRNKQLADILGSTNEITKTPNILSSYKTDANLPEKVVNQNSSLDQVDQASVSYLRKSNSSMLNSSIIKNIGGNRPASPNNTNAKNSGVISRKEFNVSALKQSLEIGGMLFKF